MYTDELAKELLEILERHPDMYCPMRDTIKKLIKYLLKMPRMVL